MSCETPNAVLAQRIADMTRREAELTHQVAQLQHEVKLLRSVVKPLRNMQHYERSSDQSITIVFRSARSASEFEREFILKQGSN